MDAACFALANVGQLSADVDGVSLRHHTPGHQDRHAEIRTDCFQVKILTFVAEHGIAGPDLELRHMGEVADQGFGNAIAEIVGGCVSVDIHERKHGDGIGAEKRIFGLRELGWSRGLGCEAGCLPIRIDASKHHNGQHSRGYPRKTSLGLAMRGVAANPEAAAVVGLKVWRVKAMSFALAGALGGLAGCLVTPITTLAYDVGVLLGLKGFAAAILGGFGSFPGAILGGLTLGLLESLGAAYISSAYKDVIAFIVLLLVLFIRPRGLLGRTG